MTILYYSNKQKIVNTTQLANFSKTKKKSRKKNIRERIKLNKILKFFSRPNANNIFVLQSTISTDMYVNITYTFRIQDSEDTYLTTDTK